MGRPAAKTRPLSKVARQRMEKYQRLAYKIAYRYHALAGRFLEADDLVHHALLGLAYAARTFDPKREVPFGPWAAKTIAQRIIHHIDYELRRRHVRQALRFSEPLRGGLSDEDWDPTQSHEPDPAAQAATLEQLARIRRLLCPRHWRILWCRFAESMNLDEIAAREGVSKQRVLQLLTLALRRVRTHLPQEVYP